MKIFGSIEICNRMLPSLNISGKRRSQSFLSIGKQPGTEAELLIVHQSTQNKLGTKYKVKNNIEHMFTRFVEEGKATIRFKNPPHDISIVCDPLQLKLFLRTLKLALEEKVSAKTLMLSSITPTSNVPPAPKTKYVVLTKAAYPTLEGFPRTLQMLKINHVQQDKFDNRIVRLHNLKVLDLSHNNLTSLPQELGMLSSLKCLYLSHNKFGEIPAQDRRWDWIGDFRLARTLEVLDLSHNELCVLPKQISKLRKLSILIIESNQLSQLPSGLGILSDLRSLVAGCNKLHYLPGSMRRLHLDSLDLASNFFDSVLSTRDARRMGVPSLVECAARSVIRSRLFYSPEIIPRSLVFYLDNAHFCVCGSPCFEVFVKRYVPLQLKLITNTLTLSENVDTTVPTETFYCSYNCIKL